MTRSSVISLRVSWRVWLIALSAFALQPPVGARGPDGRTPSAWNAELLDVKLHGVRVEPQTMENAWMAISINYLLPANFYMAQPAGSDSAKFAFSKEICTGRELVEAFLAVYPTYSYTQDRETGVAWVHPKTIRYEDILSQKIRIKRPASQVPAFDAVIFPLCRLLGIGIGFPDSPLPGPVFDYAVDLPKGVYSARDIVNFCCIANPTKAFRFFAGSIFPSSRGGLTMLPDNLFYSSRLAPPRAEAVRFWEIEFGKSLSASGIPSDEELCGALADPNPGKRWAARIYLEAAWQHYPWFDVIGKSHGAEQAAWAALGLQAAGFRGSDGRSLVLFRTVKGFADKLVQIKDPGLALVTSLELNREKQDTSYLDAIVRRHKYTEAEVASVKPDIYRLAHESRPVLDRLKKMRLHVPEFSRKALRELEDTNLLTLFSVEKK
jgi:hypothetical protein